jgi:CheY-like chemotaxis protein
MPHHAVDIVVADDNAVLLKVLSEIFQECGYSVRTASDGLAALGEIRDRAPDILLSDLNMPCMSGFELLSIVRRRYPGIKVIAMSGSYPGGVAPQGVAADAFYEKSAMSVAQLLLIVNALKDETELRLLRVSTPIWIPRPSNESSVESSTPFACPECLRSYPCSINESDSVYHRECPYCLYPVQLAIFAGDTEAGTPSFLYYFS